MNVYTTDKIRNVVLLGHGGCGKQVSPSDGLSCGDDNTHGKSYRW